MMRKTYAAMTPTVGTVYRGCSCLSTTTEYHLTFRSTSCGRWMGRTRRTPACWSTSTGRSTGRPGWSHRSRRSTCARVGRWSWSSSSMGPSRWSPSAYDRQYPGTWTCHRTWRCWRTGPYGYQCRTSWSSGRSSREYRTIPYRWRQAGTGSLGNGNARCQWWWPIMQEYTNILMTTLIALSRWKHIFYC